MTGDAEFVAKLRAAMEMPLDELHEIVEQQREAMAIAVPRDRGTFFIPDAP